MNYILSRSEINQRETNEDSCLTFELSPRMYDNQGREISILLLSDGMGGHQYGEIVSHTAIRQAAAYLNQRIIDNFTNPHLDGKQISIDDIDFRKTIADTIVFCNNQILKLITNNRWKKAGATLVIVIVVGETFYYGYLGDSRLYHWSSNSGQLRQMTYDHSIVGIALKEGAITPQVAKYHAQKHQLVYFMGIEKVPSLEKVNYVGSGTLKRDDVLLLCSDGISGKPEKEQIEHLFNKYLRATDQKDSPAVSDQKQKKIGELAQALIDLSISLDETDNQSLVIFVAGDLEPTITTKEVSARQPGMETRQLQTQKTQLRSVQEVGKPAQEVQPAQPSSPDDASRKAADIPEDEKKTGAKSDSELNVFLLGFFVAPLVYLSVWAIGNYLGLGIPYERLLVIVPLVILVIGVFLLGIWNVAKLVLSR
jgi:serine/threonine protein phosphatase PrpC